MVSTGMILALTVIGLVIIFVIRNRQRRCTIPGPRGWPLVGVYPFLSRDVFKDFWEMSKTYGDMFKCRFGTADAIVISKYEIIDDLFRKRPETFNDRFINIPEELDIPIGFGELQYCAKWKEMRTFTINVLNDQNLGDRTFQDLLTEEVSNFSTFVSKSYGSKPFYPKKALMHCMGNIILSLVFGKRFEYDDPEMERYIVAAHDLPQCLDPFIFFGIPSVMQILGRFNIIPIPKLRRSQVALDKIAHECHGEIAEHQKVLKSNDPHDFVDVYLNAANKKKSESVKTYLTENSLKGVATNLFAAGLDSTATMLIWFVLLLTKHQRVQRKLREEVDEFVGSDRLPTLKDRDSMPYTKAVLQEAHRYASVAPMGMYHMVAKDTEYRGYFIPKGTCVIANYWAMHHDEKLFPNPFDFKPERFIDDEGGYLKSKYVAPYGIGKRVCPGEVLAQRELFLFVTLLVQKFELLPADGVIPNTMPTEGFYDGVGLFPPYFETSFVQR